MTAGRALRGLTAVILLFVLAAVPERSSAQDTLRAAAIVNDEVISMLDLAMRTRLAVLASGLPMNQENLGRLQPQVLRTLIDERIQMQEAGRLDISVKDEQLQRAIEHIARQNNLNRDQFVLTLQRNSILPNALVDQLRAGLAWESVVRRRLRSSITISDEEIDEVVLRVMNTRDKPEVRVSEIFLNVDNVLQEDEVRQIAQRLFEQLKGGARFDALARQFSQSATAAVGGDLGWVRVSELPEELAEALERLQPGQVAGPVRTLSGFYIVYLQSQRARKAGKASVSLKQILFPVAPGASAEVLEEARQQAADIRSDIGTCEEAESVAQDVGGPGSGDLGTVNLDDLPEQVRDVVTNLQIGKPSNPIQLSDAIGILVVCDRDDDSVDRDKIRARLTDSRQDLLARRYLRDLRRAANVDVRL